MSTCSCVNSILLLVNKVKMNLLKIKLILVLLYFNPKSPYALWIDCPIEAAFWPLGYCNNPKIVRAFQQNDFPLHKNNTAYSISSSVFSVGGGNAASSFCQSSSVSFSCKLSKLCFTWATLADFGKAMALGCRAINASIT